MYVADIMMSFHVSDWGYTDKSKNEGRQLYGNQFAAKRRFASLALPHWDGGSIDTNADPRRDSSDDHVRQRERRSLQKTAYRYEDASQHD